MRCLPAVQPSTAAIPAAAEISLGRFFLKDQRGFRRTVDGNRDRTAHMRHRGRGVWQRTGVTFYSDVDFDGDGRNDIGVYREGTWFILRSSDGGVTATGWGGLPQDIPVPGDYDGDGKTDVAVYRDGRCGSSSAPSDGGITSGAMGRTGTGYSSTWGL